MAKKRDVGTAGVPAITSRNLPTNWQEEMAQAAKAAVDTEASVASGQWITTRAGQLSYQGTPFADNKMKVVVLDAILENCYYPDAFDPDNPASPVCYAFGRDEKEMRPHEQSSKPQSETCAGCKWNEFETADTGKGKACKNVRRLALVAAEPLTELAIDKGEVAFLKIPVTSVKGWAAYVRSLSALWKRHPGGVVTQVSTRPDPKTQFKVIFEHLADLPDRLVQISLARAREIRDAIAFPYPEPQTDAPAAGAKKPSGKKKF